MESSPTLTSISSQTIAIIGNPNVGKSSIFNQLTGLNQKIGNYPGVTVDKTVGSIKVGRKTLNIIDLPGTYSIFPKSEDEMVAFKVLSNPDEKIGATIVVLDACNLERGLLLATQVMDYGLPMALIINMKDLAEQHQILIKTHQLYKDLGVPIILTDARKAEGMESMRSLIIENRFEKAAPFLDMQNLVSDDLISVLTKRFHLNNTYQAYQFLAFSEEDPQLSKDDKHWISTICKNFGFEKNKAQVQEVQLRNQKIQKILSNALTIGTPSSSSWSKKIDQWILHPVLGYFIFLGIMLLIFQGIFAWAEVPMDWIDRGFAWVTSWASNQFPEGVFTDFLVEGLIPGLGGIVIFVPQIALLFGFLAFLEDTGYLSRVVFLMDRLMRPLGLHGKSVVPLISGLACAIPGVMASRTISNSKERLITILVTPWMSCSARLPIYIILIGLVIPNDAILGVSYQALALLGMYVLGTIATLSGAFLLNKWFQQKEKSYLLIELPIYRFPRWKAVAVTMFTKSKVFVLEAGKVILSISIILWVLASYGPPSAMKTIDQAEVTELTTVLDDESKGLIMEKYASKRLEASYMGMMGKGIEPLIQPLGYDWKIGIALITSFAAREVFVGTIATIYSIGGDLENELTIREKLSQEVNPTTGEKVFDFATGISLMVFYAFAMQCMSTLAVVRRETKTWKWPILQTLVMSGFAYLAAFITYQLLK
jgi:ferrous iron transport protein B